MASSATPGYRPLFRRQAKVRSFTRQLVHLVKTAVNRLSFLLNAIPVALILAMVMFVPVINALPQAAAHFPKLFRHFPELMGQDTELGCLALHINNERAEHESTTGLLAIGIATQNRLLEGFHQDRNPAPHTLCDVVWEDKQMSWTLWDSARIFGMDYSWQRVQTSYQAAADVLMGTKNAKKVAAELNGADHYLNAKLAHPVWMDKFKRIGKFGSHTFFRSGFATVVASR